MTRFHKKIKLLLINDLAYPEFIENFFITIRKQIDETKHQNEYMMLYFFCNWVLHNKLERGEFIINFLDKLSQIWVETKGVDNLTVAIQDGLLDYELLRTEIIKFIDNEGLNSNSFKQRNYWKKFLFALLELLSGIPLERKNNKSNLNLQDYIDSFSIIYERDDMDEILMVIAKLEGGFTYNMKTRFGPELVGTIKYLRDL